MQGSDEWGQNYREPFSSMPELSFDEAFDVADFAPGPGPKVSSLSSKGTIGKPIRRRSRASKKAPTTLLTADSNSFRALVQQFTGCHSAPPAFGNCKGPINLDFEQRNYYSENPNAQQHRQLTDWSTNGGSDRSLFSFATNNDAIITNTTTTTAIHDDGELLVSRVNEDNSRPDPLTIDDFDVDNVSIQELSDYSTAFPGTRNDDLWGN